MHPLKPNAFITTQEMFEASRKDMDEKKKKLDGMFAFHKHSTSPSPKDVCMITKQYHI